MSDKTFTILFLLWIICCLSSCGFQETTTTSAFDISHCESDQTWKWDSCVNKEALNHQEPELCKAIVSLHVKKDCIEHFALTNKDASLCQELSTQNSLVEPLDAQCREKVNILQNGKSVCESAQNKPSCLRSASQVIKNVNICFELELYSEDCAYDLAVHMKDPNVCDEMSDEFKIQKCKKLVQTLVQGESFCEQMTDNLDKNFCFEDLAQAQKDPTYCDKITDPTSKTFCYNNLATVLYDPTICKSIDQPQLVSICESLTQVVLSNAGFEDEIVVNVE